MTPIIRRGVQPLRAAATPGAAATVAPTSKAASVAEVLWLIRQSEQSQLARVQLVADAAHAAAAQVTDKRFEKLSDNQSVTMTSALFDLLLNLVLPPLEELFGQAVAKELATVLAPATDLLGKWSAIGDAVDQLAKPQSASAAQLIVPAATMAQALVKALPDLVIAPGSGLVVPKSNVQHPTFTAAGAAVSKSSAGSKSVVTLLQSIPKLSTAQSGGNPVSANVTDTPTASLVNAAQMFTTKQRFLISVLHAQLEICVSTGVWSPAQVADWLQWEPLPRLGDQSSMDALDVCARRFALFFEAAIWAGLYGFGTSQPPSVVLDRSNPAGRLDTPTERMVDAQNHPIDDDLIAYWTGRLIDPTSGRTFADSNKPHGIDGTNEGVRIPSVSPAAVGKLFDHLSKIGRKLGSTRGILEFVASVGSSPT